MQLFMTGLWVISCVLFLLCFYQQPTIYNEEESITSTDSDESYTEISVKIESGGPSTTSGIVSDANFEQSYEVLEVTGVNGAVRVVPYYASRESTPSLKHSRFSSPVESVPDNDNDEVTNRKKSCRAWLCSVIKNILMKILWAGYMLVWEEIVVLLYVLFIMLFCEMAVEVCI